MGEVAFRSLRVGVGVVSLPAVGLSWRAVVEGCSLVVVVASFSFLENPALVIGH
jgi:hypothetical protein